MILLLVLLLYVLSHFNQIKTIRTFILFVFTLFLMSLVSLIFNNVLNLIIVIIYFSYIVIVGKRQYLDIKVSELNFKTNKVNKKYKFCYLSDFQFDKSKNEFNDKAMDGVIDKVNSLEFDYLLLGGDYINYEENIDYFMKKLSEINCEKIYAVLGNHDYVNVELVVKSLESLNIKVLFNDKISIDEDVVIVGVEDEWKGNPELVSLDLTKYNLCLSHNPDFIDESEGLDLMLSGHYHGGQVRFLNIQLQKIYSKYISGYFSVNNTSLYVSNGLGGSFMRSKIGMYLRYKSNPEIVIINLEGV